MPLLYKQSFVPERIPSGLQPSDAVFHCKVTGEIFTDYELVYFVFVNLIGFSKMLRLCYKT